MTLHLFWFLCRSKAGTGRKAPTASNICSTFCERNNEFILTNKSKSSLNCEVGGYSERKNNKLKINCSPLLWVNYAHDSKQILLRWFSHNPLVLCFHAWILCMVCTKMDKRLFLRYKYAYAKPSTVRLNHLHIFCNRKIKRWQEASN